MAIRTGALYRVRGYITPAMLPRIHTPEPLSPRLRSALLGVVILDAIEEDADILIVPGSLSLKAVQLWRDQLQGRLILGIADAAPDTDQRIRWVRAGADDLCSVAELPEVLGRLWAERTSAGAGRVEQFLWELQGYLHHRDGLTEAIGSGGVARLNELGRRRDAVTGNPEGGVTGLPQGFRWPVELMQPRCAGSLLKLHPDTLSVAVPEVLRTRDPVKLIVRSTQQSWLLSGEVQRAQGTSGSWWVYTVLLLQVQVMDSGDTTG